MPNYLNTIQQLYVDILKHRREILDVKQEDNVFTIKLYWLPGLRDTVDYKLEPKDDTK